MPGKLSTSVVIKSADRGAVQQAVEAYVEKLRREHPEIERVFWFGSWVNGLPMPRSDVDICVILSSASNKPRDRIVKYLPLRFPTGLDLFVYTRDEFDSLRQELPHWYQTIISGREFTIRRDEAG